MEHNKIKVGICLPYVDSSDWMHVTLTAVVVSDARPDPMLSVTGHMTPLSDTLQCQETLLDVNTPLTCLVAFSSCLLFFRKYFYISYHFLLI